MYNGINKVILLGNIGREPQLRTSKNGRSFLKFSVATNMSWKNEDGEHQTRTDWHKVAVWGKRGENLADKLVCGMPIVVSGYLSSFLSQNQQGEKFQQTWINADLVEYFPKQNLGQEPRFNPLDQALS